MKGESWLSVSVNFEARILWHSAKWLPFIKWPSSNEIDFGDFTVEFDFKQGVAMKKQADGTNRSLLKFTANEGKQGVLGIRSEVAVGDFVFRLAGETGRSCEVLMDSGFEKLDISGRAIRLRDWFTMQAESAAGRVVLNAKVDEKYADLATGVACFLVFDRYVQDRPPAGGEFDKI